MRALLSWLAGALLVTCGAVRAQVPQSPHRCEPWPACAIVKSPLFPGAPTPSLQSQGKANSDNIFSGDALTNERIKRDTLRLPTEKEPVITK
jgi:hypothetical protein